MGWIDIGSDTLFVGLVSGCSAKGIEYIEAGHLRSHRERFVRAVKNGDQLRIVLCFKQKFNLSIMLRKRRYTSIDFKAISVKLPIFDADNRFAWTTSLRIDSKS